MLFRKGQGMLSDFIRSHHDWLTGRARELRLGRGQPPNDAATEQGFALFFEQLVESLEIEQAVGAHSSVAVSGPQSGIPSNSKIGEIAYDQGAKFFLQGTTIDNLVHSYGDLCHSIVDLVQKESIQLQVYEFRMLNHCLDNAIATAVTEFSFQHDEAISAGNVQSQRVQMSEVMEHLRREMGTASTAIAALRARELSLGGVTGGILERSLRTLSKILNELPNEASATLAANEILGQFSLQRFMEQVRVLFEPCAQALSRKLSFGRIDPDLGLQGNRDALLAALNNLLQIMLSHSAIDALITVSAYGRGTRILIDIACPYLPNLLSGDDPALLVARELLQQNKGKLIVRNNPNEPAVLTASLPRATLPT